MKKILYSVMALAIAAISFTACEDVPEPYPMPDPNGGNTSTEVLEGTGTQSDPFNVAAARAYIKDGGAEDATVYVKGIIVNIEEVGGSYDNATYNISDDGTSTNQLKVYRGYGLGNSKFKGEEIKTGDVVVVSGQLVNFKGTYEFTQGNVLYSLNGETSGGGNIDPQADAKGDGTLGNPFNAVAATIEAQKLQSGAVSDKAYYIKGKVASIAVDKNGNVLNFDQGTFGNATFYLSDDGTETNAFYCYRVLYLGNEKWTQGAGDILKVGDEVIVCAKLTMYNSTPETQQNEGYLYSLNGKTERSGGGQTPQPSNDLGTADSPITVAKALEIINGYEPAGQSDTDAYVKGKIVSVDSYNDKYKSITYYISDDGTENNQLQVYSGKGLNGADFASTADLKVGSVVVVKGQLKKYVKGDAVTPEINQNSQIISIDGQSGGSGGENPGGSTTSSLANGDFETWADGLPTGWKSASTASSATLAQSTDAHGGSFSVNVNGDEGSNKRLASQEITLAAGTYVFSFYAKATTADAAQVRPGHVPITDGKAGTYAYGEYANLNNSSWTQVTHEFKLDAETTVCLVAMNPKKSSYSSGKDILIDDATLTKK